jgi:hypothetical protein
MLSDSSRPATLIRLVGPLDPPRGIDRGVAKSSGLETELNKEPFGLAARPNNDTNHLV